MKTEALFMSMLHGKPRKSEAVLSDLASTGLNFFSASHYEHIRPMFQAVWMSVLTSISGPLQEVDDTDLIAMALEGFKYAAYISCLFDMDLERKAFISTLTKNTNLGQINDIKLKNIEAARVLVKYILIFK